MESFVIDKSVIGFDISAPVILYFGVVAERRGIFDAIEAFEMVTSQGHKALLLIIGPVDKKDSKRFFGIINSAGNKEKIIHIPWIDISLLPTYLDISDICLAPFIKNPQHESGVANKIYDYMLGSKPVIASDCRPQKNLIENENCGLVYSNINEFRDAVVRILDDETLRKTMGENGRKAILKKYHTGIVKDYLIDLYRTLPIKS
jgi:glycosyltransferase involved in cell wall biosynthesis